MYTVFVTLDIRTGHDQEFLKAITENAADSLRLEPGCQVFEVLRSTETPGRIHLYEVYADEEAFLIGHKSSDHFRKYTARSTHLIVPGSKFELHAVPATAGTSEPAHDH
ncbi:putative quinol monooxygenase [Frigoribacterium sp. RIT-PI-h]|uniref:putative quinol monooxygenase n=1 Tax=Frigoribacterium sp. RIT-PI-h TaxID=1690245 RepID=UPI0006B9540E|nr:putative quinol monooxygenase [Frigoribacterium sp. RIT-PI-h]